MSCDVGKKAAIRVRDWVGRRSVVGIVVLVGVVQVYVVKCVWLLLG